MKIPFTQHTVLGPKAVEFETTLDVKPLLDRGVKFTCDPAASGRRYLEARLPSGILLSLIYCNPDGMLDAVDYLVFNALAWLP